jgi:hypothetical protein
MRYTNHSNPAQVLAVSILLTQFIYHAFATCYFPEEVGCADPAPPGQSMFSASVGWIPHPNTCQPFFDSEGAPLVGYATQSASVEGYRTIGRSEEEKGNSQITYNACCMFTCQYLDPDTQMYEDGECVIPYIGQPNAAAAACPVPTGE